MKNTDELLGAAEGAEAKLTAVIKEMRRRVVIKRIVNGMWFIFDLLDYEIRKYCVLKFIVEIYSSQGCYCTTYGSTTHMSFSVFILDNF